MPYHTKRKRRRRRHLNTRGIIAAIVAAIVLLFLIGLLIFLIGGGKLPSFKKPAGQTLEPVMTSEGETLDTSEAESTEPAASLPADIEEIYAHAQRMAAMYDYQGAVSEITEAVPDYESYPDLAAFVEECQANDSLLVKWADNTKITHVFFHTLIMDAEAAFGSSKGSAYNEVMTTIDEFNKIIESMYERGYVMVTMKDMAEIDPATGQMTWKPIYLPEGKIPFVLSEDDVSYYEYMNKTGGYAQRLSVTDDGRIMNEVDNADGTVTVGAFDVLPLIDEFLVDHPDFSYHGSKGYIALTGYNGILGYRTSYITYGNSDVRNQHSQGLFANNGLFDTAHAVQLAEEAHAKEMNPAQDDFYHIEMTSEELEAERAKAKAVADAIKADGWLFASHTWGHMPMSDVCNQADGSVTSERLYRDSQWWEYEVESLIGETDTIIFAKGADIGSWRGYSDDNQTYMYLKSMGFNYYANVDSSRYYVQMSGTAGGSGYLRQGRRNLDGTLMFKALMYPEKQLTDDLFDVAAVFDPVRPLPVINVTLPEWYDGSTLIKPDWAIESDAAKASEEAAAKKASEEAAAAAQAPEESAQGQ